MLHLTSPLCQGPSSNLSTLHIEHDAGFTMCFFLRHANSTGDSEHVYSPSSRGTQVLADITLSALLLTLIRKVSLGNVVSLPLL